MVDRFHSTRTKQKERKILYWRLLSLNVAFLLGTTKLTLSYDFQMSLIFASYRSLFGPRLKLNPRVCLVAFDSHPRNLEAF